jgi:acetyl-CoA acetyltransferase
MMNGVVVIGGHMVPMGKYPDRPLRDLGREAIEGALGVAGVPKGAIQAAYVGSSFAGIITGQEAIRGQVALRAAGIGDIPVLNFENACAGAASAFHAAAMAIAAGQYDLMLVVGVDKLWHRDRQVSMRALGGAMDVVAMDWLLNPPEGDAARGSLFMDYYYGRVAREHMERYGTTERQLALVAVKNRRHATLNPFAQYRTPLTIEDVLAAPMVSSPLTTLMCSPLTDGAGAVVLASADIARRYTTRPVTVAATAVRSGQDPAPGRRPPVARTSREAYEQAGLGPEDLSFAEVHEASAVAELIVTEEIGLCGEGEGGRLLEDGTTHLGGQVPVNPGGGLLSRGHPGAATGMAQIVETCWQLAGTAGERQVKGATVGLTHSSGGLIGDEAACTAITILKR